MKKVSVVWMVCLWSLSGFSQTWNEWFRQKRTQIRYLGEQIAALKVYGELINEGYSIAKDGLTVIADIKNGDFNLHSGYFNSLIKVNPSISGFTSVVKIDVLESQIEHQIRLTRKLLRQDFLGGHAAYVEKVLQVFGKDVRENAAELALLLSNNNYAFTDDERLQRIEMLYQKFSSQYAFSQSLYRSVVAVVASRQMELGEIRSVEKIHDIKPE